jgi:YVTN family beta-propeller protein
VILACLVAAATVIALLVRREPAPFTAPRNSVAVIDPRTNRVVAAVPVGIRPGPIVAGGGFVWVGNLHDRNLSKIAARQRTPLGTVTLDNRTPTGLAFGAGAVWVAHGLLGRLSRPNPYGRRRDRCTRGRRSVGGGRLRRPPARDRSRA